MRVILLRHGIAVDRNDPNCPPDPERPLTPEGVERTRDAVRGLHALGVRPGVILSSPYVRAMQTAQLAAKALDLPEPEPCRELLPAANPKAAATLLVGRAETEILCAGHEPHLGLLLALLVWGAGGGPEFAGFKKAGAACVETRTPGVSSGDLLWFLPPRILRSVGESS